MPPNSNQRLEDKTRYTRINVSFHGQRPSLDDVKSLEDIEQRTKLKVKENPEIYAVAQKLVASCFYFDTTGGPYQNKATGIYQYCGNIRCRFDEGSADMRGLGQILGSYIRGSSFVPYFLLQENYDTADQKDHHVPIALEIIQKMCDTGLFQLQTYVLVESVYPSGHTNISLCLEPQETRRDHAYSLGLGASETLPTISGFPRELFCQDGPMSPMPDDEDLSGETEEVPELPDFSGGALAVSWSAEFENFRQEGRLSKLFFSRGKNSTLTRSMSYLSLKSRTEAQDAVNVERGGSMEMQEDEANDSIPVPRSSTSSRRTRHSGEKLE